MNETYEQYNDFFEILTYAATMKYKIFMKNPYLLEFSEKVIMRSDEEAGVEIRKEITEYTSQMFTEFFARIDYSRFRDGIDPMKLMRMLTWMAEGYMFENNQAGKKVDLDQMMKEYQDWVTMFRKIAYKEEWQ